MPFALGFKKKSTVLKYLLTSFLKIPTVLEFLIIDLRFYIN